MTGDKRRARFDAEVSFANGGGLTANGFVLDIPGEDIGKRELGELFVRHLGLLMVGDVRVTGKEVFTAPHKGSRGVPPAESHVDGRHVVELSHPISDGMITYPGLPGPDIGDHLSFAESAAHYAPGTEFRIGRITMVANTGTYLDSPGHRYADGPDIGALPLEKLVDLPGVLVRADDLGGRAVDRSLLVPYDVAGRAVLIHTGWDRHWGTDRYGEGHPFLTADAAAWLVEHRATLVGIDSLNIDNTDDGTRSAHTTLLGAGIPIVEHLCGLGQLPPVGFRFHAAPAPVCGMASFPVRAYALV